MRRTRIFSIIVFVAALAIFTLYKINTLRTGDHAGPRITMSEETLTVPSAATDQELLAGVKAEDKRDGDVTDSLIVESKSNFIEKGRRKITIAAFDSDNNVTKTSREIVYSDYRSPSFSLEAPLRFPLDTQDIISKLSVQDVLDGTLTANIKISGEYSIKEDEAGEYPMMFTVSNSAGDVVNLPVTVEIYDPAEENKKPRLNLSQYIAYTSAGVPLNPWDFVQSVVTGGTEYVRGEDGILYDSQPNSGRERESVTPEEVEIIQNVDYNTAGVYEVVYRFTPENGSTGQVRLIVCVV